MRLRHAILLALLVAGTARLAVAVPPGLEVEFEGGRAGKVTFSGAVHSGEGMECADCHMEIFHVSRASAPTRDDHDEERFCFVCHDGETAFAPRRNCTTCHLRER